MPSFALDTSCLVAAVCSWHEHHAAAADEIDRRLEQRERMVTPLQALVEAYAVLTRLPAPHRLAPRDAWALLRTNFVEQAAVAPLPADAGVALLEGLALDGMGGGRTYDAVIAESARLARADILVTFNRRHFEIPSRGVQIVEPAAR